MKQEFKDILVNSITIDSPSNKYERIRGRCKTILEMLKSYFDINLMELFHNHYPQEIKSIV